MPATQQDARPHSDSLQHWLLRGVCALMFAGHGWVCWNGNMPLRALLWDEALFSGVVEKLFGMGWGNWVSSLEVDDGINQAIRVQGIVFFAMAVAALLPWCSRWLGAVYLAATGNLIFLAWLKYHGAGVGIAQFFEHSSQFMMPVILLLALWDKRWIIPGLVCAALTFTGHGLFALGVPSEITWLNHPRPGKFTEMTMLCLGLESEIAAGRVLIVAAILDFVAAALLCFRGRLRRAGLIYMIAWGLATSVARPWAYYEPTAAAESLKRWIPEMLYRAPHFGLPLCLLLALRPRKDEPEPQPSA